jgi:tRNA pseudouridine38-40 synthase
MALRNIKLDIEYDGTDFSGWQSQPNANTVQDTIEEAIKKVTGREVSLIAAGRTDAGVHALGQVANFKIDHYLTPDKYRNAINYYLPDSILILSSSQVDDDFNARRSASWRHYRYIIGNRRSALYRKYRWELEYPLEPKRMNEIAAFINGRHDFSAFCVVSSLKDNNECGVDQAQWRREKDQLIFDIRADRFLHTMVRSLVGIMAEAGKENDYLTLEKFKDILNSRDHTRLRTVAPGRGLYLVAVGY